MIKVNVKNLKYKLSIELIKIIKNVGEFINETILDGLREPTPTKQDLIELNQLVIRKLNTLVVSADYQLYTKKESNPLLRLLVTNHLDVQEEVIKKKYIDDMVIERNRKLVQNTNDELGISRHVLQQNRGITTFTDLSKQDLEERFTST